MMDTANKSVQNNSSRQASSVITLPVTHAGARREQDVFPREQRAEELLDDRGAVDRTTLDERHREVDAAFNPYWGSVFAERTDASMFGSQLEEYACVYTSRVSNFYYVSPARYFRAPHGAMPHWRRF